MPGTEVVQSGSRGSSISPEISQRMFRKAVAALAVPPNTKDMLRQRLMRLNGSREDRILTAAEYVKLIAHDRPDLQQKLLRTDWSSIMTLEDQLLLLPSSPRSPVELRV